MWSLDRDPLSSFPLQLALLILVMENATLQEGNMEINDLNKAFIDSQDVLLDLSIGQESSYKAFLKDSFVQAP